MNKRVIIILAICVLVVVGAAIATIEFLSYKNVSFLLKKPGVSVAVYTVDDVSVGKFESNATTQLKEGNYYYVPEGENYASDEVRFEVDGDETIEVSPPYSADFLASLLSKEQAAIRSVLLSAYPEIKSEYIIGDEHLAQYGEWYFAKLIQRVSGGNEPDVYRVILKKENATWSVAASPQLVLSIAKNNSIPEAVIRQANEPLSTAAYALLYPE